MNRLEREVLQELEAEYEFEEDRAVAIVALCKEAFETDLRDEQAEYEPTVSIKEYYGAGKYNTITLGQYASGTTTLPLNQTITANDIKISVNNLKYGEDTTTDKHIVISQSTDNLARTVMFVCNNCGYSGSAPVDFGRPEQTSELLWGEYERHAKKDHPLATGVTVYNRDTYLPKYKP